MGSLRKGLVVAVTEDEQPDAGGGEWYFNIRTGEVERGALSDWTQRIGPYPSESDARAALALARRRNQEWDEADKAWRGED